MANLPTSIKNLNTLLGEQLTEGGGGGADTTVLNIVSEEGNKKILDHTWQEVKTLLEAGQRVVYVTPFDDETDPPYVYHGTTVYTLNFALYNKDESTENYRVFGGAYNESDQGAAEKIVLTADSSDGALYIMASN